jgi:inosine-uridine nucleoside N-ribohydrolase
MIWYSFIIISSWQTYIIALAFKNIVSATASLNEIVIMGGAIQVAGNINTGIQLDI